MSKNERQTNSKTPQLEYPYEVIKNRLHKLRDKLNKEHKIKRAKELERIAQLPKVDYSKVCQKRYEDANRAYNKQLLDELKQLELYQQTAYEAMRFHRHFVITTLWPPLHTRKEVEYVLNVMTQRTKRQDSRLKDLIKYPQY